MRNTIKYIIFVWMLTIMSFSSFAQNYCLHFSKEKKKNIIIEEGKKVSFVIQYNEDWQRGVITKITIDSLFIEQKRAEEDKFTERENNYEIIGYAAKDFRMIAYTKTSRIVGEGAIVLVAFTIATLSYGGMIFLDSNDESPSKQWFMKNIDFEEGWEAKIVACQIHNN